MRVVHIAYLYGLNNTGGACMAATRLHLALLRNNVDSHFICLQQKEPGPNVHELPRRGILRAIQYVLTRIVWVLGYLTPEHRIIMPNLVPLLTLEKTLRKIKPDIVHIHWYMMDTISFAQLANMPCPVVMTLHDLFDVSIESPCPGNDFRYVTGLTTKNSTWTERWMFQNKHSAMKRIRPLMIGPSQWICKTAQDSIIGRGLTFCCIGNVYDPAFTYTKKPRTTSSRLQILFGANGGRCDPNKGWEDFVHSLEHLDKETKASIDVIIFGEDGLPYCDYGIPVHFAGVITSATELCRLYNSADIAVVPSRIENAPNVKFEAWLCGLPVIAFNRTGCAEQIKNGENGWIANDGDFDGFARGISYFYNLLKDDKLNDLREVIAKWAKSALQEQDVVKETRRVYERLKA